MDKEQTTIVYVFKRIRRIDRERVLADGAITAKEREVLHRKAAAEGIDADEQALRVFDEYA